MAHDRAACGEPREREEHRRDEGRPHTGQRQGAKLVEPDLARGKVPRPEDGDHEEEPVGLRVTHGVEGRSVADMDRPCREGADRAERRYRLLTSSFSWRPSSSSPSCHPPPVPRVPRLVTSVGILGDGPETCQAENTTGGVAPLPRALHLGEETLRFSRERKKGDDARDASRIPG